MRHKRDFYTPFLPFDDEASEHSEQLGDLKSTTNALNPLTVKASLLDILTLRLSNYLAIETKLPKNFPILKLLASLNKITSQDSQVKFTEDQAAELLKTLGATIDPSPTYLGRSRYRVTISQDLANRLLEKKN
ncbi:MAG: hypothetical protein FD167_1527 [bacterium]|nr:MAG: hypothetical protein FD167_1527 [bacterium]